MKTKTWSKGLCLTMLLLPSLVTLVPSQQTKEKRINKPPEGLEAQGSKATVKEGYDLVVLNANEIGIRRSTDLRITGGASCTCTKATGGAGGGCRVVVTKHPDPSKISIDCEANGCTEGCSLGVFKFPDVEKSK